MENKISIEIKSPCAQNYNHFTPTAKGGFCNSCEKEVIDFTKMNPKEITAFFKDKNNQNTCGRISKNYLNREIKQNTKINFLKRIGIACLSFFSFNFIQAQEVKTTAKDTNVKTFDSIKSDFQNNITVKGIVSDDMGPIADISVVLQGTTIGTITDFDGHFEFPVKLKDGDVLMFEHVAYPTKRVTIKSNNNSKSAVIQLKVKLEDNSDTILMGKLNVKKIYHSKGKS